MARDLTARQREIFEYIKKMIRSKGRPPSIREIGENFKINSTNGVRAVLEALERKGYIKRDRYTSRGIELLKEADESVSSDRFREVNLIGNVAAGSPILAEQNIEGSFLLDRSFVPGEEVFSLRVRGDSMIDAMVNDGDYVILRPTETAQNGEMVAIWLPEEEETTLKYFYKEKDGYRFQPANPNFDPIRRKKSDKVEIKGKVVMVVRQVRAI